MKICKKIDISSDTLNIIIIFSVFTAAVLFYYFHFAGGLYMYSYDDLLRVLNAKNWINGQTYTIGEVWLPLPKIVIGISSYLSNNFINTPSLLNLLLTLVSLLFIYKITINLFPNTIFISRLAILFCMLNRE